MTKQLDCETRTLTAADFEIRRLPAAKGVQLVGHAVRFDSVSDDLGFREQFAPGAFAKFLAGDSPDVRALVDHDPTKVLGRTMAGTLSIAEDDRGLRVEIDLPDTTLARDLAESIQRGDLSGMSIGFHTVKDSWSTTAGEALRTIHEAELFDVSVVAFPAYPDTSVAVRSLTRFQETNMQDDVETPEDKLETPATQTSNGSETPEQSVPQPERRSAPIAMATSAANTRSDKPAEWRDARTGREVRVLKHNEKFADLHKGSEPLSLGKVVRSLITADWSDAPAEHRALSTVSNPSAGILIPNPLASRVIDLMRNRSVLSQIAQTVAFDSSTLTIARLATDATMEVKGESSQFTGSDLTFDAVNFTAFTIGAIVKMSRELAADAPNAVSLIENAIASKLAERVDFYGLQGSGSAQPLGLLNFSSTNTEAVGGSVDYDNVLNGISKCEVDNHTPNAYLSSPTNINTLRQLKVNSEANHYAAAPPAVQALQTLVTANMPDTTAAVIDGSKFMIGLRQSALVEVSTESDTAFAAHEVWVKITTRVDFAIEDKNAVCLLTGIS